MSKISQIIAREYITRVRRKAFIIMSVIGPLLFAGLMIGQVWLASLEDQDVKKILVVELDNQDNPVAEENLLFRNVFEETTFLRFDYIGDVSYSKAEQLAAITDYFGVLIIRYGVVFSTDRVSVEFIVKKQPSIGIESMIKSSLGDYLKNRKLLTYNVPPQVLKTLETQIDIDIRKIENEELMSQKDMDLIRTVAMAGSFLIYMFIFFFGAQVMRGVVEEKSNRIVEVIITSVKPFQLMMGKIIGIGLVGLTQFLAWIILSFIFVQSAQGYILNEKIQSVQVPASAPTELFNTNVNAPVVIQNQPDQPEMDDLLERIRGINFTLIIGAFVFYFIGGFLLYGAMFAAIGAASDSDTDTQQFMLPVTIPLILSLVVMANAISNPEGQIAFWFSIIPFTSPIVMMARIAFGVPDFQFILSAILLIITFVVMTWLSAKIYRTGILMYGKKVNFRDLFRWMRNK